MRERFLGYYPPNDVELASLWDDGLIVLDANALLNLYRYSTQTRDQFLEVLRALATRLWIPYQVGLEFHRRRLEVIDDQLRSYDLIQSATEKAEALISAEISNQRRHSADDKASLNDQLHKALAPVLSGLSESHVEHIAGLPKNPNDSDPILEAISGLYFERVGLPFSEEQLSEIYSEGKVRYAAKIPPGYRDIEKGEPRCYGDLILWKEILHQASQDDCGVLFVTDDAKDDWWRIDHGRTLGPRVELVDEFIAAAGHRTHFYSPEQFLRFAKTRNADAVSDSSLGEVEDVSNRQTESHIREVVLARRNDLLSRLQSSERSLFRIENNVKQRQRDDALAAEAEVLRRKIMERSRMGAAKMAEVEQIVSELREWKDGPIPTERFTLAERAVEERSQLQDEIEFLADALRDIEARREEIRIEADSNPGRVNTYRQRINVLTSELRTVEAALAEMDQGDLR